MILSIITPCYNPPTKWEEVYLKQVALIEEKFVDYDIEFIVVNDGSSRDFASTFTPVMNDPRIKLVSYTQNQGKGYAIREGVKAAEGKYIIYTDYDFPFGLKPIFKIFDLLQNGIDVVIGTRTNDYFFKLPLFRKIISFTLKMVNYLWLPSKLTDTQAGIKGFKSTLKHSFLGINTNSFVFEIEFLRKAVYVEKANCDSISVTPNEDIEFSNFSWKQIWKEIKSLFRILILPKPKVKIAKEETKISLDNKALIRL